MKDVTSANRLKDQLRKELGRRAEEVVAHWLVERCFEIVATNLHLGHLEVDIVARKRDLVVVVEVRTRTARSFTTAFGSITEAKRRRLRRAARLLWLKRYRHDLTVTRIRIDAAAVYFDERGAHVAYTPAAC